MDSSSKVSLAVFITGAVAGGIYWGGYLDGRVDALEHRVEILLQEVLKIMEGQADEAEQGN